MPCSKMNRVLVFGAGGFIGTYLVDQLVGDRFEALAIDKSQFAAGYYKEHNIPFMKLDITHFNDFTDIACEETLAVVNLACVQPANVSKSDYNPTDYIRVNVIGVLNILEFCRRNGIRKVIHVISHRNTQGSWEQGTPIREDDPRAIKYTGEYAMFSISESAATDCVEHYSQEYGIQGTVLRLPPVYGYGPHLEIFKDGKPIKTGFQIFIEKAMAGEPIEVWGEPDIGRDIVYVKDVVSAITLALKSVSACGLYNIASGRSLSLREQAEGIATVFSPAGSRVKVAYRHDKPNSIEPFVYDISRARRDLGWYPKYSFQEMLLDFMKEAETGRFRFLLEKRRRMLEKK